MIHQHLVASIYNKHGGHSDRNMTKVLCEHRKAANDSGNREGKAKGSHFRWVSEDQ